MTVKAMLRAATLTGVASLVTPGAIGDTITLAEDGKSDYVIVRPADASPSVVYAAEELQSFLRQITDAELPIRTDAEGLPEKAILVGPTDYTASMLGDTPDLETLGDDGFRLCVRSPHIVILGSQVRGTLYGVYELLETYCGCRWYASCHSVVPKHSVLRIPQIDDTQVPAFVMREPFWWDMFEGDFAARSSANGNRMQLADKHGGKIRFGAGLFVHTFYRLMPPSEFFGEHPEYYSEIDGKRTAEHAQLCLTNPDVVRICTERMLSHIRNDPTAKLYSLSQNDWRGNCACSECKAIDDREGTPAGSLIQFVNQVAEAVEKEFPHAWIETLAYQYTRKPPKTVRPRHNVVPRLCTIECDFSLPLDVSKYEQNVRFVDEIRGWRAITDKLYIWDYTTNFRHYTGPHPNFNCLQGNARFFRDNGVVGLFEQGAYQGPHAEFAELRAWLLAKLLWNPDCDVQALYDDFFPGFYGPAASVVRQYFDELQALTATDEHIVRIFDSMNAKWLTDEFLDRASALWAQAEELAKDDPVFLRNVRMSAIPVLYARLERWPHMAVRHEWSGERFEPSGVDADYAKLARDLRGRLGEAKGIKVAENGERHATVLATLAGRTDGFEPAIITQGPVTAGAVAELGGRICLFTRGDSASVLDPDGGGIDSTVGRGTLLREDASPWQLTGTSETKLTLKKNVRHSHDITRTVELGDDGLHVVTSLKNLRAEAQTKPITLRAAFDLGNASAACIRFGDGEWQPFVVPEDQMLRVWDLRREGTGRVLDLASPVTRRAVRVELPDAEIARLLLVCDVRKGSVRLVCLFREADLESGAICELPLRVEVRDQAGDLPTVAVPARHRADRITVDESFIPIGHEGKWGEYVDDPAAEDGRAAKLFNTHYEWCMQWRVDPAWFDPGARYRLRVRVRVEKSEREGKAFWAGVYDLNRKKGQGDIAPHTTECGDGYEWHDVATWVPEAGQYAWIGPGQFDKEKGETSAIQALYVDRFELVREE